MNGHFTLPDGTTLSGSLSPPGPDCTLSVWGASAPIEIAEVGEVDVITGILADQKRVSLLDCIRLSERQSFGQEDSSLSYEFFPHQVILGTRHISPDEAVIAGVTFAVDDIAVFYPQTTRFFGTLFPTSGQLSELIASGKGAGTSIPSVGEQPILAYYTDANGGEIFSTETVIGKVSAWNAVTVGTGGSGGAGIQSQLGIHVRFAAGISVEELQTRLSRLLRFFDIVIGRPQNLVQPRILLTHEGLPNDHAVHFNLQPSYERSPRGHKPDFRDILINTMEDSHALCGVLRAWLERDDNPEWHEARTAYFSCWRQDGNYSPQRLAGAANAFDFLPSTRLPQEPIEAALQPHLENFQKALGNLPSSGQRDNALSAIGRITAPTLKRRIQARARTLTAEIGDALPDVDRVIEAAVDCRNLFVHGPGDNQSRNARIEQLARQFVVFFTDTLEFIFAASDLVEAGWDIASWSEKKKFLGHPFCGYLHDYPVNLAKFKREVGGVSEQNPNPS